MLQGIDDLLGLDLMTVHDVTAAEKDLIARRETARGRQDWAESDRLRDELAARGIGLHDHPHGVIWFPRSSPA
jgi:cysteinyl-tRNA synthetase